MDETSRRLQIASDLFGWVAGIPRLLVRIGEVSEMPSLTEAQKLDLDMMAKRITDLYARVSDMADAEEDDKVLYEKLIASTDRLREEIAIANVILDKLKAI